MSNLLQVSMPQVWADNLRSELIKRLENRNISVEILTHGQEDNQVKTLQLYGYGIRRILVQISDRPTE